MSDVIATASGPAVAVFTDWASQNTEAIASLGVLLFLAVLDGLKKVGPFTKTPWLLDALKLAAGPLGNLLRSVLRKK